MGFLEHKVKHAIKMQPMYQRYVDDISIMAESEIEFINIFSLRYNLHANTFMDVLEKRNGVG